MIMYEDGIITLTDGEQKFEVEPDPDESTVILRMAGKSLILPEHEWNVLRRLSARREDTPQPAAGPWNYQLSEAPRDGTGLLFLVKRNWKINREIGRWYQSCGYFAKDIGDTLIKLHPIAFAVINPSNLETAIERASNINLPTTGSTKE